MDWKDVTIVGTGLLLFGAIMFGVFFGGSSSKDPEEKIRIIYSNLACTQGGGK